jgi:hypothetical protein
MPRNLKSLGPTNPQQASLDTILPLLQQLVAQRGQQGNFNGNLQQFGNQGLQGPLSGLANQQNQGSFSSLNQQNALPIPQATDQNTSLPVRHLDENRTQQPDKSHWYDYLAGPFAGLYAPNSNVGRWWNDTLFGEPPKLFPASRFTDFQQNALNYITQNALHGLGQSQFSFAPIANQQLERFNTQTIPSLAERFTAMGNGQRSSAFQGALGNAGRFLGNDLAALQSQYGLQQQGNLQNLLQLGLTPQFENIVNPAGKGIIPTAVDAAVQVAKAVV